MRSVTAWLTTILVMGCAAAAAALDCERVRALDKEGKRASEIARTLSITTPDVQACLANEGEPPGPVRRETSGLPLAPALRGTDAVIPRPPNQ